MWRHYKFVINGLLRRKHSTLIDGMPSKITLALGTALAGIALCCFIESSFGQDALVASLDAMENDDRDAEDKDDKDEKSGKRRAGTTGHLSSGLLTGPSGNVSLGLTSVGETAEVESVVVTGTWFDAYPVPYPALPPVEGTKINAGKKTSFVKPAEFPTFAGNDYREVMATTPGILVSEEPQSPIINFGYRGLNSQRSEFMQVLEDGISLKNEQFGFPETHYTPILDAVERIELIRAGAALQIRLSTRWSAEFRHENAASGCAISFHNQKYLWQLWVLPQFHGSGRYGRPVRVLSLL